MKQSLHILKIGGNVQEDESLLSQVLHDFAHIQGPKLLVHGGGKRATAIGRRMGIEPNIIDGRRITDAATLEVAMMVYGGLMNKRLVAKLQALGINALGLTGADLNVIRSVKRPVREIDYGFVGDIEEVNEGQLGFLLHHGITPVMASLTHDGQGTMLNTNADTIASVVAQSLADLFEVHLVYCFEKAGVLINVDDPSSLVKELDQGKMEELRSKGSIADGMLPKLSNAFAAVDAGVKEVLICHASAIDRLGTPEFVGTRIS